MSAVFRVFHVYVNVTAEIFTARRLRNRIENRATSSRGEWITRMSLSLVHAEMPPLLPRHACVAFHFSRSGLAVPRRTHARSRWGTAARALHALSYVFINFPLLFFCFVQHPLVFCPTRDFWQVLPLAPTLPPISGTCHILSLYSCLSFHKESNARLPRLMYYIAGTLCPPLPPPPPGLSPPCDSEDTVPFRSRAPLLRSN